MPDPTRSRPFLTVLVSVTLAAGTVRAEDEDGFRFHGYLRSGFGVAGTGDPQEAFRAPNSGAKYRLGNETEAYVETTFAYGVRPEDEANTLFDTRITVSYVTPTSNTNNFETTTALREAFVLAKGVWKSQDAATFWAGQRFFDRHDLHMSDFYYRDLSGFGGGLEGVRLGEKTRLGVAWLGGSLNELNANGTVPPPGSFQLSKNTFDVRLYDLPLLGGRTALAFDLSAFTGDTLSFPDGDIPVRDNTGWAAAAIHERPIGTGRNKLSVQYGTGAAFDFRAVLTPIPGRTFSGGDTVDYSDVWQLRVVEDLQLDRLGPFTLQLGGVWQEIGNGAPLGGRITWLSLGARPAFYFNRHFSLELEAGFDHSDQAGLVSGSLVKVTLAPQITPRVAALSRPSLRAYVTWARWSDGFVGLVAPLRYGAEDRGFAAGVQIETWW
jgi:maltoporin